MDAVLPAKKQNPEFCPNRAHFDGNARRFTGFPKAPKGGKKRLHYVLAGYVAGFDTAARLRLRRTTGSNETGASGSIEPGTTNSFETEARASESGETPARRCVVRTLLQFVSCVGARIGVNQPRIFSGKMGPVLGKLDTVPPEKNEFRNFAETEPVSTDTCVVLPVLGRKKTVNFPLWVRSLLVEEKEYRSDTHRDTA